MNIVILNSNLLSKNKNAPGLYKVTNKQNLLEIQIKILNQVFKKSTIYIVSSYKYKKIKNITDNISNVYLIENPDFETTNSLYSLKLVLKLKPPILILPDNLLFTKNIFKNLDTKKSQIWTTKIHNQIGCVVNDGKVEHIAFDLPYYWSNIVLLTGKEYDLLEQLCFSEEYQFDKWFIHEALNWIISRGGQINAINKNNKISIMNKSYV